MSRMAIKVKGWLHPAAAAFQLLTRLPMPVRIDYDDRIFRRSVIFYPFVGAVLGLLLALAAGLLVRLLPSLPSAALMLACWAYLTGGLHWDGLMDTADGLFSYRSRERMLEIMKDSRVGAMGVLACVLMLFVKGALLESLLEGKLGYCVGAVFAAAVWSRAWMTSAIAFWPYARAEGTGMGSPYRSVSPRHAAAACVLAFALAAFGLLAAFPPGYAVVVSLLIGAMTVLLGGGLARAMARRLGGLTGDTYGAMCELLETLVLLAMVVAGRLIGMM